MQSARHDPRSDWRGPRTVSSSSGARIRQSSQRNPTQCAEPLRRTRLFNYRHSGFARALELTTRMVLSRCSFGLVQCSSPLFPNHSPTSRPISINDAHALTVARTPPRSLTGAQTADLMAIFPLAVSWESHRPFPGNRPVRWMNGQGTTGGVQPSGDPTHHTTLETGRSHLQTNANMTIRGVRG
jgi:hypothetical protein